ncbi:MULTISPECIES: bpX5 domain-containing protein [Massilia]|uniref:MoxR-vWA-beta-propeller ternary system domain-containing protein n=2 Tax=Massilia TaxID=149698 RepID=A0ABX0LTL6_9BURK|nr:MULTISPECIES: hypothetical protein [Massilia]NHZ37970.1 hypothetical protein [Massilia rubra]NHZ65588.1 hypothetical protein [Massilia genomosp. 1]
MSPLGWMARPAGSAPEARGQVSQGAAMRQVLARLARCDDEALAALTAVATRDMLVLLGRAAALPWVDGARYCAPDPLQRMLWLPTDVAPQLPLDLVLANLAGRGAHVPFLLWDAPEQVLPLGQPIALDRASLAWLARELAA